MLQQYFAQILSQWPQAIKTSFSDNPLAILIRQNLKEEISSIIRHKYPNYEVKASAGNGNWANVPWLSILNPSISNSTQNGIYPVYLFRPDGSGVYLSLNQGTTQPQKELGKNAAELRATKIANFLRKEVDGLSAWGSENIHLNASTSLGKSYETPNIVARFYDVKNLPNDKIIASDLLELLELYEKSEKALVSFDESLNMTNAERLSSEKLHLPKPFILLAGISGTGKSRYVKNQASVHNIKDLSNYCLIPVRPDWHEPSDLLGYISGINTPRYIATEFLIFIVTAWKNAFASADKSGISLKPVDQITPYWLCLDEMNLAPVEQYFADYLAVMETCKWSGNNYECEPLLKAEVFSKDASIAAQLRNDLKLNDAVFNGLWEYFSTKGIPLPPNLIVAGTVNMDETTHGFSRKVIDRAFSIDFGAFFPNDFSLYFGGQPLNKKLSFPVLTSVSKEDLRDIKADSDGAKSITFISRINDVLANTPFELAYRALNELLISVVCFQPTDDIQLQAVWDDFLMTKVLPRIEGDAQKLQATGQSSLLIRLTEQAKILLNDIWNTERPDLLRSAGDGSELKIACRSKQKLSWMEKRLSENEFTSFWP
jgi:hypothetical protein